MSLENVVVLDAGSCTFKAGLIGELAGDEKPSVVTRSAVRDTRCDRSEDTGTEVAGKRSTDYGRVINAVEDRTVADWDAYEALLDEILYGKLGWAYGDEGALLASEALFASRDERERLTQLAFEHNNVAGFFLGSQPVLALFAVGKLSGSVVDIGHTTTDVSCVFEGQVMATSSRRLEFGMRSVSEHLQQLLGGSGTHLDEGALDTLAHAIIRVPESADEAHELLLKGESAPVEMHTLPDGQTIQVKAEGVELGEALLNGWDLGLDVPTTPAVLLTACMSAPDTATRKAVLENLVVCGGGSVVSGLPPRILRDFRALLPPSTPVLLAQAPEYMRPEMLQDAVWMGAAIASKIVFLQNQHISKGDYNEQGPTVVHHKCCMA